MIGNTIGLKYGHTISKMKVQKSLSLYGLKLIVSARGIRQDLFHTQQRQLVIRTQYSQWGPSFDDGVYPITIHSICSCLKAKKYYSNSEKTNPQWDESTTKQLQKISLAIRSYWLFNHKGSLTIKLNRTGLYAI